MEMITSNTKAACSHVVKVPCYKMTSGSVGHYNFNRNRISSCQTSGAMSNIYFNMLCDTFSKKCFSIQKMFNHVVLQVSFGLCVK